ncbi:MAG: hypothetical protein HDR02_14185 [Lachnospiraceae bacterium]|nr:hypothetical protein [Lachnospiraceae bacterium]
MKKGKSTYQFPINVDPNLAQQTIMNWLGANGFDLKEKDGNYYYQYYDPVIGRRLFEFYIQPGMVTINAYLGKYKKPYLLDDSFAGSVPKSAYKTALAPLFQTLSSYNAPVGADGSQPVGTDPNASYNAQPYVSGGPAGQPVPGNYEDFTNAANKSHEKLAIWGFVLSIVGLLLSFVGYTFGFLLYMLEFYFAACGIKTKNKGFAIATFVLAGVSIVILVISVFLQVLI